MNKQNTKLASSLAMIVVGMVCLAYAAVPLYDMFCRVTGFGGTTQVATTIPDKILDRTITVQFNTDIAPDLPWNFASEQREVDVHVGESRLVFFNAENPNAIPSTGISTFNVTPDRAGRYFNKVQCFCFENQTLNPGEKVTMPVSFFIDPAIMDDNYLDDVSVVTLSYTFFKAKQQSRENRS